MPLYNSPSVAIVELEDYQKVIKSIGNSKWCLYGDRGRPYVRAKTPNGSQVMVAREITAAAEGERVYYLDGNRLNLLRENLRVDRVTPEQPARLTIKKR